MPRADTRFLRRAPAIRAGLVAFLALTIAGGVGAQENRPFRLTPTLSADVTWTDNVDLAPRETRQSDFVLSVAPGFTVDYSAPRALLRGGVSVPILLYARTSEENNEVRPVANLVGRLELVRDLLFVEATAAIEQTYFNPFGPRSDNLTSANRNRIEEQRYSVTPYLRSTLGNSTRYEIRNESFWTLIHDNPVGAEREYTNRWFATINRDPMPFGFGADVDRTVYRFDDQEREQFIELARIRAVYSPGANWEVYATGGFERNEFTLSQSEGAIYGGGLRWRPTDRTLVDLFAEHRFFGTSYQVILDHRTPLTTWNFRGSRNITTDAQQIGRLPAGSFVPGVLNQLLLSRIPDPQDRALFIANFMIQQNLPLVLNEAISLNSQRILLEEFLGGSVGFLGTRNTVVLSAYYVDVNTISGGGSSLPPAANVLYDYAETGAGITWSYRLGSQSSLTTWGKWTKTRSDVENVGDSTQWLVNISVNRTISPRTTLIFGARHHEFDSTFGARSHESAVFAGFNYTYH